MLHSLTVLNLDQKPVPLAFIDRNSAYQLAADSERFAQGCASGLEPLDAYYLAHQVNPEDLAEEDVKRAKAAVGRLVRDTTVVLRIQELKQPVLRKLRKRFEYSLQKALEQCQVAYDLAYSNGDVNGLLKAIDMQARLAKLLSEEINVTHKYGMLDDASTATLLEMRKEIEVRQSKAKRLRIIGEEGGENRGEGV